MLRFIANRRSSSSSDSSSPSNRFWRRRHRAGSQRSPSQDESNSSTIIHSPSSSVREHIGQPSVPLETVRALLLGEIDPVELAKEILPDEDIASVVEYSTTPYKPDLDIELHEIHTVQDVIFVGLAYVGFAGRKKVGDKLKLGRFCAHYKLWPETVLDVWNWFNEYDEDGVEFKRLLYTLNFLKLYSTEHVLSGRWKMSEKTLEVNIWKVLYMIQSHTDHFIYFDPTEFKEGQVHIMTVDTVSYKIQEPRTDPSTKWYDQKSNSAGLKYEMALPIGLDRTTCIWSKGPYEPGIHAHDGCLFRGGKLDDDEATWDPESLYNQIPDGKKAIGDGQYSGMPEKCTVSMEGHLREVRKVINKAKSRQERYHGHTKEFNVLEHRFRHGKESAVMKMKKHKTCVDVIHVLMHFELIHRPLMVVP